MSNNPEAEPKNKQTWCMGPDAGVDYNLTLCPLKSRLQHIYHGQPYARVDLNPMPESTLPQSGTLDLASVHTDKKENQIFLTYREIQGGAVAKSYMTNGLLIYGEIFAHFLIY